MKNDIIFLCELRGVNCIHPGSKENNFQYLYYTKIMEYLKQKRLLLRKTNFSSNVQNKKIIIIEATIDYK